MVVIKKRKAEGKRNGSVIMVSAYKPKNLVIPRAHMEQERIESHRLSFHHQSKHTHKSYKNKCKNVKIRKILNIQ